MTPDTPETRYTYFTLVIDPDVLPRRVVLRAPFPGEAWCLDDPIPGPVEVVSGDPDAVEGLGDLSRNYWTGWAYYLAAEDAEMDAQEQEANRIQEMLAGQTLPARVAS